MEAVRAARAYKAQKAIHSETNIFGDPLNKERPADIFGDNQVVTSYQPLSAHIEKNVEIGETKVSTNTLEKSIEDIYASAEDLIRAGKSLEAVSVSTKLSLDELRLISRMIQQDDAMRQEMLNPAEEDAASVDLSVKNRDDRLGVLGNVRRQSPAL